MDHVTITFETTVNVNILKVAAFKGLIVNWEIDAISIDQKQDHMVFHLSTDNFVNLSSFYRDIHKYILKGGFPVKAYFSYKGKKLDNLLKSLKVDSRGLYSEEKVAYLESYDDKVVFELEKFESCELFLERGDDGYFILHNRSMYASYVKKNLYLFFNNAIKEEIFLDHC